MADVTNGESHGGDGFVSCCENWGMSGRRKLDVESWARRPHFEFFSTFEEPYYGVVVNVDCGAAYRFSKSRGISFFLYYLYQSLAAAQEIEPFRQRMEGKEVYVYDRIDGGSTIGRSNGTFGYGLFLYRDSLEEFLQGATREVERVRAGTDLTRNSAENVIRYSALPWLDFTSLSHARMFSMADSCPRISFGRMTEKDGKKSMPVAIHVNHALVDGIHVGQYVDRFQELMSANYD